MPGMMWEDTAGLASQPDAADPLRRRRPESMNQLMDIDAIAAEVAVAAEEDRAEAGRAGQASGPDAGAGGEGGPGGAA